MEVMGITEEDRVKRKITYEQLMEGGYIKHPFVEIWVSQRHYFSDGRYRVVDD
jgi:hypothetical protein